MSFPPKKSCFSLFLQSFPNKKSHKPSLFLHIFPKNHVLGLTSFQPLKLPISPPWSIICRRLAAKRKMPGASVLATQSPRGVERAKCQSAAWQSWRSPPGAFFLSKNHIEKSHRIYSPRNDGETPEGFPLSLGCPTISSLITIHLGFPLSGA